MFIITTFQHIQSVSLYVFLDSAITHGNTQLVFDRRDTFFGVGCEIRTQRTCENYISLSVGKAIGLLGTLR